MEFYLTLAKLEPHELCIVLPDFAALAEMRKVHPEVVGDFPFSNNSQLVWALQWPSLDLCFPYCFSCSLFFCTFAGPTSWSYQPQLPQRGGAKQGKQKLHFCVESWHQWGTNKGGPLGSPPVVLVSIALAYEQPGSCCGFRKWSEDLRGDLKRQNMKLQILIGNSFPKCEGQQRKEHDWACFESITVRGRYLGS